MQVKRPRVTGMDLVRARQIVRSLPPLKQLSGEDAELVARAIAECFANGRKQGQEQAVASLPDLARMHFETVRSALEETE